MKALIIYDTVASALKAIALLRSAECSTGAQTAWKIKLWRIDLMRFPSMAGEALREASDASLIMYTVRRTQGLPAWIEHWLDLWAMDRKIADAAVALMVDDAHDAGRVVVAGEMSKFAAGHNMTFIANGQCLKVETLSVNSKSSEHSSIGVSFVSDHMEESNGLRRYPYAPL